MQHLFQVYYVARQLLPSLFGFFISFFSYFLYILYYKFFKKSKNNTYFRKEVATGEGLEPPTVLPATVFKTAPSSSRIPAKCVSTKNNETFLWWGTWDLNPHVLRRQSLNLVRLPFRQSPIFSQNSTSSICLGNTLFILEWREAAMYKLLLFYCLTLFWCGWWDLNPHGIATNGF